MSATAVANESAADFAFHLDGWTLFGVAFQYPIFFLLLLLIPLIMFLRGSSGRRAAITFSSIALTQKLSKQARSSAGRILMFMRLLALTLLILAIARPRIGEGHSEVEASGIDIMLAVDVSGSMAALDFATEDNLVTRLDVVKDVVAGFIDKRKNDRLGLMIFAKEPYLISPPTLNHGWLIRNLERIRLGIIDESRTGIGTAIGMCTNRMREIKAKSRIVVLLTDGEETSHVLEPIPAAEAAKAYNIKIYTIAAGKSGRVLQAGLDKQGNFQYDRFGRMVANYAESNVDEAMLKKVASITNGDYFRATDREELENIYNAIDQLEKTQIKLRHYSTYQELFMYFAIPALCLLLIEQLLSKLRYRRIP